MTEAEIIALRLNRYSELFDRYIDQPLPPPPPPPEGTQDPLLDYLHESLADSYQFTKAKEDITWRESFKSSLLSFFTAMLPSYMALEREQRKEMQILHAFFDATIDQRRQQWASILAGIQKTV